MHPNARLIDGFYQAFSRRDYAAMYACYHPDATFSDPAFSLAGWKIGAMWRMLCTRGKDLLLHYDGIIADDHRGSARWSASYTFSATGRKVHNIISAQFTFRDAKIMEHRDSFSLYRWSRMALGPKGVLLGWLPPVQHAIRSQAAQSLEAFIAQHSLSAENVVSTP